MNGSKDGKKERMGWNGMEWNEMENKIIAHAKTRNMDMLEHTTTLAWLFQQHSGV